MFYQESWKHPNVYQNYCCTKIPRSGCRKWGGGLRGVWSPFPEIGRNRPFSPFFCLFRLFPEGQTAPGKSRKQSLVDQISSDLLKPPSLKTPFVALQPELAILKIFGLDTPFWVPKNHPSVYKNSLVHQHC